MAVRIMLEKNGAIKSAPVGFSWTTFFFGFFVPLFRGDFSWFLIMIITPVIVGMIAGPVAIVVGPIFSFIYNRSYVTKLFERGWQPADEKAAGILRIKGIIE